MSNFLNDLALESLSNESDIRTILSNTSFESGNIGQISTESFVSGFFSFFSKKFNRYKLGNYSGHKLAVLPQQAMLAPWVPLMSLSVIVPDNLNGNYKAVLNHMVTIVDNASTLEERLTNIIKEVIKLDNSDNVNSMTGSPELRELMEKTPKGPQAEIKAEFTGRGNKRTIGNIMGRSADYQELFDTFNNINKGLLAISNVGVLKQTDRLGNVIEQMRKNHATISNAVSSELGSLLLEESINVELLGLTVGLMEQFKISINEIGRTMINVTNEENKK